MDNKDFEWYVEIGKRQREFQKQWEEQTSMAPKQESQQSQTSPRVYENNLDLILYIIVMVVGCIFYDRVWIWIVATVVYFWHKVKNKR